MKKVFFSFYFDEDFWRTQTIRNIGVICGEQPVSANKWEDVKRKGNSSIQSWIDENIKKNDCTVVLIGTNTYKRPWVLYEIQRSWELKKAMLGIHIHNIKNINGYGTDKGKSPFDYVYTSQNDLSERIKVYDPNIYSLDRTLTFSQNAYRHIEFSIESWVDTAIQQRKIFNAVGI
jgi:hypothetical protein